MHDRKHELLFQQNKRAIERRQESETKHRKDKMSHMLERSAERRGKLLRERVQLYESQERRWFAKKEEIRLRCETEDKLMAEAAKEYQSRDE